MKKDKAVLIGLIVVIIIIIELVVILELANRTVTDLESPKSSQIPLLVGKSILEPLNATKVNLGNYVEYKNQTVENVSINTSDEPNTVLFYSEKGAHNSDKMNYKDYESEIFFTPLYDMKISAIEPEIYSCLGRCYYKIEVYDEAGTLLGESFNNSTQPIDLNGKLIEDIQLKAGVKYRIYQHAWSTNWIGVYTTGRSDKRKNYAKYTVIYSKSVYYVGHNERGPIAFNVWGTLNGARTYESASWACRDKTTVYEFKEFSQMDVCRNSDEWKETASDLCNSLCAEPDCNFSMQKLVFGDEC